MKTFSIVFMVIGISIMAALAWLGVTLAGKFSADLLMIAILLVFVLMTLAVVFISLLGAEIANLNEKIEKLQKADKES